MQHATEAIRTASEMELSRFLLETNSLSSSVAKEYTGMKGAISFWTERKVIYPNLYPIAVDLLSAPASEAYVERIFSLCGDLTMGKKNRMSKSLETRVFLKLNHALISKYANF